MCGTYLCIFKCFQKKIKFNKSVAICFHKNIVKSQNDKHPNFVDVFMNVGFTQRIPNNSNFGIYNPNWTYPLFSTYHYHLRKRKEITAQNSIIKKVVKVEIFFLNCYGKTRNYAYSLKTYIYYIYNLLKQYFCFTYFSTWNNKSQ